MYDDYPLSTVCIYLQESYKNPFSSTDAIVTVKWYKAVTESTLYEKNQSATPNCLNPFTLMS